MLLSIHTMQNLFAEARGFDADKRPCLTRVTEMNDGRWNSSGRTLTNSVVNRWCWYLQRAKLIGSVDILVQLSFDYSVSSTQIVWRRSDTVMLTRRMLQMSFDIHSAEWLNQLAQPTRGSTQLLSISGRNDWPLELDTASKWLRWQQPPMLCETNLVRSSLFGCFVSFGIVCGCLLRWSRKTIGMKQEYIFLFAECWLHFVPHCSLELLVFVPVALLSCFSFMNANAFLSPVQTECPHLRYRVKFYQQKFGSFVRPASVRTVPSRTPVLNFFLYMEKMFNNRMSTGETSTRFSSTVTLLLTKRAMFVVRVESFLFCFWWWNQDC